MRVKKESELEHDSRAVFMVRWTFPDHHPGQEIPGKGPRGRRYSFIVGLGGSSLLDHLDEYGDPSYAEVRIVSPKHFGCLMFDQMDNEPEGVFNFRESGATLSEIWDAGHPVAIAE